ncbi:MAG TPA: DUF6790 family protein [Chitinophagaceae bacterium]|nr:DUF6790 family protein [Chitinophagaceae bacterium]
MNTNENNRQHSDANKQYIIVVIALTFIFPLAGFLIEALTGPVAFTFDLFAKWLIFSAVGLRLFSAGIRQTTKPEFTAKEIFHIDSRDSFPIVRELGFANICFGLLGILALFKPAWRDASAFASGLYYGLATLQHFIKKPVGVNEKFAMWTDMIIFIILVIYLIQTF